MSARARLLTARDALEQTGARETDATGAIVRGLAQYLAQLSIAWKGRDVSFSEVFEHFPDQEDARPVERPFYPNACVYNDIEGAYDGAGMSTRPGAKLPDGTILFRTSELATRLRVRITCTSKEDRAALITMIEDGLTLTDGLFGIRLSLPFYFNTVGEYALASIQYLDNPDDAQQRFYKANLNLNASVVVFGPKKVGELRPRAEIKVGDQPIET